MTLPALIEAMRRPDFYPHRPESVTLVQTHISYVFLAGDQVYKVKKAVRFSFADFSSAERRRHFCHEEVRLNRRLAGNVYLGVVAIRRRAADYLLGEEGDPDVVEYAVHMRRLPADRMLDRLLDGKAVTPEMVDSIATRLAEFHRRADAGPEVAANGDPAAITRVLEENHANARPFRDVTVPAGDDDEIHAFTRDFLRRNDALFRKRQAEKRIRDCHGDLHTEHICLTDGLIIFDCIDFNPSFRYCDVASEIAFLAMDLDYHGHPELAAHLVARYARYAGDPDLHRLVPFYQCGRAYVRGKVDSLKSAEPEVPAEDAAAARRSAWRHFALAYRYTWAYTPCLVLVAGLSGTGKSAIAASLHTRTGFAHINSDVVRKRLAGVPAETHRVDPYDTGLYAPEHRAGTYHAMFAEAAEHLAAGHGVILDATFQRRDDRDAARALAAQHHVPFLIVECQCSEDVARQRLNRRARQGDSPSDADWHIYLEQRRRYEALAPDEAADRLGLDTVAPAADLTPVIEAALRKRT